MKQIFFFILIVPIFYFLVSFLLTKFKKNRAETILKLLDCENLKRIDVRVLESRYASLPIKGGSIRFVNAIMFYCEKFLVFTLTEKSIFCSANDLPFVVKIENITQISILTDQVIIYVTFPSFTKELKIYSENEHELESIVSHIKDKISVK